MRRSISLRPNGYIIQYEVGKSWDEKGQKIVRKQKRETVPWKNREGKLIPPTKEDAQTLLAKRLFGLGG